LQVPDAEIGVAALHRELGQRLGGARGAHGVAPALLAIGTRMGREYFARRIPGSAHPLAIYRAVVEISRRQGDAADRNGLEQLGVVVAADDAFGRAAADVDHEPVLPVERQLVRGAEVDQARFLAARYD